MKTLAEIRGFVADFQPQPYWAEWIKFCPGYAGYDPAAEYKDSAIKALWEKIESSGYFKDSKKESLEYLKGIITSWGKMESSWERALSEWSTRRVDPLFKKDDLIKIQFGTSRVRAERVAAGIGGYVKLETLVGDTDWDVFDRHYGVQVNIVGGGARSGMDRLSYYAKRQAAFGLGDQPVVVVAEIPGDCVYGEVNAGEYAISFKDFRKFTNLRILSLWEAREELFGE